MELLSQAQRDVAQVAGRGGAMADFDVRHRQFARFHALQEIPYVRHVLHRGGAAARHAFQVVIQADAGQIVERGAERDAARFHVTLHLRRDLVAGAVHE